MTARISGFTRNFRTYPSRPRTFKPTSCLSVIRRAKSGSRLDARNGLDDHGFSGLRLRTARERDASRALPQCVATVPLKASQGTTSYYMPVQPEESLRPFGGRAPAHLRSLRAYERSAGSASSGCCAIHSGHTRTERRGEEI